jgi:hypothetical protein
LFGIFVDQVFGLDRSACDSLREDVATKKRETDSIDNAALALPVLAEYVVLSRRELKVRSCKGSEIGEL